VRGGGVVVLERGGQGEDGGGRKCVVSSRIESGCDGGGR
jgi:hypothetical protein